jgi:hypothetical protein
MGASETEAMRSTGHPSYLAGQTSAGDPPDSGMGGVTQSQELGPG